MLLLSPAARSGRALWSRWRERGFGSGCQSRRDGSARAHLQCRGLREVHQGHVDVVKEAYSHCGLELRETSLRLGRRQRYIRRTPSSSEDLTFARITSDAKGLNTTMRKMTAHNCEHIGLDEHKSLRSLLPDCSRIEGKTWKSRPAP